MDDFSLNNEDFLTVAMKSLERPGSVMYFSVSSGLAFVTATEKEDEFILLKAFFKSDSNFLDFHVYIEADTLFMRIGDQLMHNFTFGLGDKELVKNTLLKQEGIDFLLINMNDSGLHSAHYHANFKSRHLEVIASFVNDTYSPDVNLKDKFGEYATHETEREALLGVLKDILNNNTVGPGPTEDVIEHIKNKYDLDDMDEENEALMNEVLDYVLSRFSINIKPLGFCIHDKEELMI
jgi:hypothetical protein